MKYFASTAAVLASFLASANAAAPPGPSKGCYSSVDPPLEDYGTLEYASHGSCRELCKDEEKMPVMALWGGSTCYCGKFLPSEDDKVDDKMCDMDCQGYPDETCGGYDAFTVLLTGMSGKPPPAYDEKSSTSSSSSSSSTESESESQSTTTSEEKAEETATVTPTDEAEEDEEGGGPNVAGIAAGVVVGVVALCGLIGGAFFFMKHRKRQEAVDEYRRNATISSFVAGGKPFSESSDSRMEPSMMSQRRQSNGSIADDQDFSRRILKVTNPDSQYY